MFATCETSRLVPDELSTSGSLEEMCPLKPLFPWWLFSTRSPNSCRPYTVIVVWKHGLDIAVVSPGKSLLS